MNDVDGGREIFERLMGRVNGAELRSDGYASLSPSERRLVAFEELRQEVDAEGFIGYLYNSAGDLAESAISAARATGETELADLIVRAIGVVFGTRRYSTDIDIRQHIIDGDRGRIDADLRRLDEQFHDLEARRDLDAVTNALATGIRTPAGHRTRKTRRRIYVPMQPEDLGRAPWSGLLITFGCGAAAVSGAIGLSFLPITGNLMLGVFFEPFPRGLPAFVYAIPFVLLATLPTLAGLAVFRIRRLDPRLRVLLGGATALLLSAGTLAFHPYRIFWS